MGVEQKITASEEKRAKARMVKAKQQLERMEKDGSLMRLERLANDATMPEFEREMARELLMAMRRRAVDWLQHVQVFSSANVQRSRTAKATKLKKP